MTQTAVPSGNVPSGSFNQVKRAQSVPSPMGVQPSQSNAPSEPENDFMNALLKNDNKLKNIL